jgi:hypothetical protein
MRNTLTINIEEIRTIELHCKCGAFVSHPATLNLAESIRCASCGELILHGDVSRGKNTAIHRLMQALANWRDNPDKPCEVTFTIDAERRSTPSSSASQW